MYNPVLTAFELYGIFDYSVLNLVSKWFKLHDLVEGFPFFLWKNRKFCLVSRRCILDHHENLLIYCRSSSFSRMFDFFYPRYDRRTNKLINLWWFNRNFRILYSVFEIKNVPRFFTNLRIEKISSNLKKKHVLSILS